MIAYLRTGTAHDAPAIRALLQAGGLPSSDLEAAAPQFVVACDSAGRIIGAGALQRFAEAALLRSVVVSPEARRGGVGARIVQDLERLAREAQVSELILLTQTAEYFFAHRGFRAITRRQVPADVQQCEEFRSLCPTSAVCMAKSLARRA
jgi:amino-acid N-acetyltransferase